MTDRAFLANGPTSTVPLKYVGAAFYKIWGEGLGHHIRTWHLQALPSPTHIDQSSSWVSYTTLRP
jgi:hypothetical protein